MMKDFFISRTRTLNSSNQKVFSFLKKYHTRRYSIQNVTFSSVFPEGNKLEEKSKIEPFLIVSKIFWNRSSVCCFLRDFNNVQMKWEGLLNNTAGFEERDSDFFKNWRNIHFVQLIVRFFYYNTWKKEKLFSE